MIPYSIRANESPYPVKEKREGYCRLQARWWRPCWWSCSGIRCLSTSVRIGWRRTLNISSQKAGRGLNDGDDGMMMGAADGRPDGAASTERKGFPRRAWRRPPLPGRIPTTQMIALRIRMWKTCHRFSAGYLIEEIAAQVSTPLLSFFPGNHPILHLVDLVGHQGDGDAGIGAIIDRSVTERRPKLHCSITGDRYLSLQNNNKRRLLYWVKVFLSSFCVRH